MTVIAPGFMINDHIRLVRPLARGAMGTIWVARHQNLNIDVAVKLIAAELNHDNIAIERFRREAQCAARMRSQHVVQIFDYGGQDSGLAYIVMELLEGESLAQRLKGQKYLPLAEVKTLVDGIASALTVAHRQNIVHRDLKPANVFLAREGNHTVVKLLDFGVAKAAQPMGTKTLTEVGTLIGSPKYMSPELLLSAKTADLRCDLWALAAICYRATTGRPPFVGDGVSAIAMAILDGDVPTASSFNPAVGSALDQWFDIAFSQQPSQRYPSARAMARAFQLAVAQPHQPDEEVTVANSAVQKGPSAAHLPPAAAAPGVPTGASEDGIVTLFNEKRTSAIPAPATPRSKRWAVTERIPPEMVAEVRTEVARSRAAAEGSCDPDSMAPSSRIRPRLSGQGDFVSGSYVRLDRNAPRLDSSDLPLLDTPRARKRRAAMWLLALFTALVIIMVGASWWL